MPALQVLNSGLNWVQFPAPTGAYVQVNARSLVLRKEKSCCGNTPYLALLLQGTSCACARRGYVWCVLFTMRSRTG